MGRVILLLSAGGAALLLASGVMVFALVEPAQAAFPGKNGKVAFYSWSDKDSTYRIHTANPDGSNLKALTTSSTYDADPSWSPDGTKIAYQSWPVNNNGEIYVMNADGSGTTNLTNDPAWDGQPAWSPDGKKITFVKQSASSAVYTMSADGSDLKRLATDAQYTGQPAWSPDGTKIAFQYSSGGSYGIGTVNVDGSELTRLTEGTNDIHPSWSPDGTRIVFTSDRPTTWNGGFRGWFLYTMDADGSNQSPLWSAESSYGVSGENPAWSPDGTKIAFDVHWGIGTINVDGSSFLAVAEGGFNPDWQPIPPDTTKPTVTLKTPPDNATKVSRTTNLTATFSEEIDSASVDKSTFRLYKCSFTTSTKCSTQVTDVAVTRSSDGLTATLNPYGTSTNKLSMWTKYKATVTTGVKDMAGNALDQNKDWYFTTGIK